MNRVTKAILALLHDHDTVIVPGLGAFMVKAEGAKVNVITNQFEKPSSSLEFDPHRREDNDLLADYLSLQEEISVEEANQLVAAFVSGCFAKLRSGETMSIPEVGDLSFNDNQEMVFNAVASNDFNGDAFGLEDIQPKSIFATENQNGWKEQVTQQIKDLNTPMTVAIEHDDDPPKQRWIWWLLLLLIAGGVALWYFKFRPVNPKPEPPQPTDTLAVVEDDTLDIPLDTLTIPDTLAIPVDTPDNLDNPETPSVDTVEEPLPTLEVVVPPVEYKVFIVAGCFSIEQNALNMANDERDKGFADVFVMKRGSMYYVCYGQFATVQEAKAMLPEVWKSSPKAWILTKK